MKKPAVFLDRDGVINRYAYNAELGTVDTPATPNEFELLPGAGRSRCGCSTALNLPVIVVSNQPGIAKGKLSPKLLDAINEEMRAQLARAGARLDAVLYCRHHPEAVVADYRADCDCRKPKPGLLLRAALERNLDLGESYFIGDDASDVLAGRAAGVTTILLSPHRCTVCEEFSSRGAVPDLLARDLGHAVSASRCNARLREKQILPSFLLQRFEKRPHASFLAWKRLTQLAIFVKRPKSPLKLTQARSSAPPGCCARCVTAAADSFSSAWAEARGTRPMRRVISARLPRSKPIVLPTTFPNSPPA